MSSTDFDDIAANFAGLAAQNATNCVTHKLAGDTANHLKRTQRAVAGLAYRYLIDTGRAN